MKFHHIGIATNDIEKSLLKLKKHFNIKNISDIVYDENQDANLCMVTLNDDTKIELISGKITENFLKRRQYLYHTCYLVEDIEKTIKELENDGAVVVSKPQKAVLFKNRKVAFLMWDLGLIELLNSGGG